MIIGVDYHPSCQQTAFLVEETGEYSERRLNTVSVAEGCPLFSLPGLQRTSISSVL